MAPVLSILVDSAGVIVSVAYCLAVYALYTEPLKQQLNHHPDPDTACAFRHHLETLFMWAIAAFVCSCAGLLRETLGAHSAAVVVFFALQVAFERSATHLWMRARNAVQRSVSLIDREPVLEVPWWMLPSRVLCFGWTAGVALLLSAVVFDVVAESRGVSTEAEARATVQVLVVILCLLVFVWHVLAFSEARIVRYEGLHFFLQCALLLSVLHVSSSGALVPFSDIRLATGVIAQSIMSSLLAVAELAHKFRSVWYLPVSLTSLSLVLLSAYSAFALLYHEGMDVVVNTVGILVNVIFLAGMYHVTTDSIVAFSQGYQQAAMSTIGTLHPHAAFTIDDTTPPMQLASITGMVMPVDALENTDLDPDSEQELQTACEQKS